FLGYNGSIKKQINQAKAAVMYPPHGLHTLLTGDTGVGKSLFASLMYNYAVYQNALDKNSPFIVFNCADYASNPQLLVSHIFGHVKGAFTGATRDKFGLLSEADGGMLFLDEVHRLPPEGQEMIFYFMDTGTYGLLGETQRSRKAQILLICATTEEPNSTLLSTFLRRIPIKINIPNLA
ncbi:sigma 54-interacting transcriptional regulator, partial [Salmonella enterica subsp. enterica serovar Weltevreden]|nr:sigma 54-interacting transcriptional regulator [Salmonella enterica subsp. enterica serovar Weltevreden]